MNQSRWPRELDVVITTGGTGGHVLPAVSLADALCDGGVPRERIGFIGSDSRQETELVPAADLAFVGLPVRGLERGRGFAAVRANTAALWQLWRARRRARQILDAARVRVVCGMGGYASLPAVLAGGKRPVFVYESNSVPGIATKVGARRVRPPAYVGTAFEHTLALVANTRRVGFIVRPELEDFDRARSRSAGLAAYGIESGRRVLLVMGGSQGARSINEAIVEAVGDRRDRSDIAVVHLVGRRDHAEIVADAQRRLGSGVGESAASASDGPESPGPNVSRADTIRYVPIDFEKNMARAFGVADLVVCRSGAATCAELAVTGTPAVCVPYPHHADAHQRHNAAELVRVGAAELLDDAEVSAATMGRILDETLVDDTRLAAMRASAAELGRLNGRVRLAADVIEYLEAAASQPGEQT